MEMQNRPQRQMNDVSGLNLTCTECGTAIKELPFQPTQREDALTDACIVTIVTKSAGQLSEAEVEAAAVVAVVALADKQLKNNPPHKFICGGLFFNSIAAHFYRL